MDRQGMIILHRWPWTTWWEGSGVGVRIFGVDAIGFEHFLTSTMPTNLRTIFQSNEIKAARHF